MYDNFIIFEGMTSISALIRAQEENNCHRDIIKVLFDGSKKRQKSAQLRFLKIKSETLGYELVESTAEEISQLASGNTHGGFVAVCSDLSLPEIDLENIVPDGVYYIIDGVEDPYNFGYTIRAIYASGADGVVLPCRNWMSSAGVVAKSSAGCSELLNIYTCENIEEAILIFKSKGYRILTANIRDSQSIYEADLSSPVLFIIGGEKRGVSSNVLSLADFNIRIGYGREFKGSLPTSQAAAIIAFEVSKYNKRIK